LILSALHIKMKIDWIEHWKTVGGHGRVRRPIIHFSPHSLWIAVIFCIVSLGVLATPSENHARNAITLGATSLTVLVHGSYSLPAAALRSAAAQDPGQAAPASTTPVAPKPVELPDGDGKPVAMEYCQDCHRLTNLTKAHKDLDDWKDTLHTMIDRGSRLPDDKIDLLAQYLTANFGPKAAAPDTSSPATAPAATALAQDALPGAAAPSAPAKAAVVELPDGDGKAIATENCQACHKLTNLTKAHKSLDDWKDTVQTMIDRGANVPADKVDTLVQYLAKNFGPKDAAVPASAPAAQ
jgi:cytochrome c5